MRSNRLCFVLLLCYSLLFSGCLEKRIKDDTVYIDYGNENIQIDFIEKVSQIDINQATLNDVIALLGEPESYLWNDENHHKKNLSEAYTLVYQNGLEIQMLKNEIHEIRFYVPNYIIDNSLRVGLTIEEVENAIGKPNKVVENSELLYEDGVLYKDINGVKGLCYYERLDKNVRMFFTGYRVNILYKMRND